MDQKKEQAFVGIFVIIAISLLIATIFAISGLASRAGMHFNTAFKNAGGLEPGSIVRYAGIRVGRVEEVIVDPKDATRVLIKLGVDAGVPVKTDSLAKIASVSALGENFLEITPGKPQSPLAKSGDTLPSKEAFGISDVADMLNQLGPNMQDLVTNLNGRVTQLQTTLDRTNDMLNDQNRAHIAGSLNNLDGMLAENRPHIKGALTNIDASSAKLGPLVDQFQATAKQADETIKRLDAMLGENRAELHGSLVQLHKTLTDANALVNNLNRTTVTNSDNIDALLDNIRLATENLREFTDTINQRPSSLIRSSQPPEHKPGGGKP
jgi:phospholipid/cholesterol/gamma-HCH transport system substrate-binding protein